MTKGKKKYLQFLRQRIFCSLKDLMWKITQFLFFLELKNWVIPLYQNGKNKPNFKIENSNIMNNIAAGIL